MAMILAAPASAAPATVAPATTTAPAAFASPAALRVAHERLWLGSAWYPEQWPEERWPEDLRLMRAQGANVVRIGEYAWSRMEPEEGRFDFGWLVRAIRLANRYGLKVVLGTPTDTPPAWLTERYPDTLRIDGHGVRLGHGGRRQFSISSARYRAFARDIVTRMAEAVQDEPNVIGWQIGNEPTDESYDAEARAHWVAWLRQRYGTLDRLNAAWTTQYWSQSYGDWNEVPFNDDPGNPGWMLELKRFITSEWHAFHQNQIDALRAVIGDRQFITINLGGLGWANRFDRYDANRAIDLASWDDYVGTGHLMPYRNGATHDLVRGWKRQNFWVMETQPGFVNWAPVNNILYPGETRAMAWQAVGHGADAILFWQWRNARNGQETMHGSLLGQDGKPLPIYAEAQQIGRDFAKASAALQGTTPVGRAAILQDYPSRWAIDFQRFHRDYDPVAVLLDYYRPLKDALGAVDIVEAAAAPLAGYRLVVAPSLNIIDDETAQRLVAYVRAGGQLILGPRSGMRDQYDRLLPVRQPGPLAALLGGEVAQYYALDAPVAISDGQGGDGQATIWAEMLRPTAADTQVVLRYGKANGWLDGQPAALRRRVGQGSITYVGALIDEKLMQRLIDDAMRRAAIAPDFAVPEGVERMVREGEGRRITILVNHGGEERAVRLPTAMTDILAGGRVTNITLPPQGVAVLQR